MEFEWDPDKAASNVVKHGIAFSEAATVFGDPLAVTYFDPKHLEDEDRFLTFGYSLNNRLLVVSTHRSRWENSDHQCTTSNCTGKETT